MNAASYIVGTAGGNREDVRGALTYLEPDKYPFTSMLKVGEKPKATLIEKGADAYRAPNVSGTREGDPVTVGGNQTTKRKRFGTYMHRWLARYGVTDVQQLLSQAGGNYWTSNEYSWARAKALVECKRDMEATHLCHNDCQGGSDDEMKERGAFKWLDETQTPQIPADFVTPAAQRLTGVTDIVETGTNSLNSVLKSLFDQNGAGENYDCFIGSDYTEDVDMFTRTQGETTAMRYSVNDDNNGEVTLMVKVFSSSFGRCNFIPSSFLRCTAAGVADTDALLMIRKEFWELFWLESPSAQDDQPTAAGVTGYIKAIGGIHCAMPKGNAYIYNA